MSTFPPVANFKDLGTAVGAINLTAGNQAPTIANIQGDTSTQTEDQGYDGHVDVGGDAIVSDFDSADFDGGSLVVAIANYNGEDSIGIYQDGILEIDASNHVLVNGVDIGIASGGYLDFPYSGTFTVTFGANATVERVQELVRHVFAADQAGEPTGGTRDVTVTLTDGDGSAPSSYTTSFTVVAVNDEPVGADATITIGEDSAYTLHALDFGFAADASGYERGDLQAVKITSLPTTGTLYLDLDGAGTGSLGTPVAAGDFIAAAEIGAGHLVYVPAQDANGAGASSFTFQVQDDGGTDNGGIDLDQSANTITFDIIASNLAPVAVGETLPGTAEDVAVVYDVSQLLAGDSDPDAGDTIHVSWVGNAQHGTVSLNAALGKVTFTPAADYSGPASFDYKVMDDHGVESPAATETLAVTPVNDNPFLDLNSTIAGTGTNNGLFEQDPAGAGGIAPDAVVTDSDSADFDTGTLTVSIASNGQSGDQISIIDGFTDLDYAHTVTTSGNQVLFDGTAIGTFTAGDSSTPLLVTFNENATPVAASWVAKAINVTFTDDNPSASVRTLHYVLTDGDGGSASADAIYNVTAQNDAPVLTAPVYSLIGFNEDSGVATPLMQGVTLSDPDLPASFVGGSLTLTVSGGEGALNLKAGSLFSAVSNGGGGFNLVYDNAGTPVTIGTISGVGTATLSVTALTSGATQARLNDLVDDFDYIVPGDNPTPGDKTVTLTFNDGHNSGYFGDGALAAQQTQTLQVNAFNDAPVNSLGGTIGTGEDAQDAWLSGMSVSDPDADPANDKIYVTFQVANGTLEIRGDVVGGITTGDILAQSEETITLYATQDQINATLAAVNGLTYSPDLNFNGDDTLTVTTNDGGLNGSDPGLTGDGTNEEDVDTRTIVVSAVDDAPVAKPDAVSTNENAIGTGSVFADNGSGADNDVDGPPLMVSAVNGVSADVGQQITLASGAKLTLNADGTYSYDPNGKFNALNDGSSGAVNTTATDTFEYTVAGGNTVTVTVTINGITSADDVFYGDSSDNTITGTEGPNVFIMNKGGNDTVIGNGGNDYIYYGDTLTAGDSNNGGAGTDTLGLLGNYELTLGINSLVGIERLAMYSGSLLNNGPHVDYSITSVDANVAAGERLFVMGNTLLSDEVLVFNGSAETDGSFFMRGGAGDDILVGGEQKDDIFGGAGADQLYGRGGNDYIVGGLGADSLRGGAGADVFHYDNVTESTSASMDHIVDFQRGLDHIDLSSIDANTNTGQNDAFTFIGFGAFTGTAGELHVITDVVNGGYFVEGDIDGDSNADIVIHVDLINAPPLTAVDFYL
jgi:VCBS repeat-containing protein